MASKPEKDTTEPAHAAKQKTPEQIAAEIVGNGRKPVILAIATVIVLGVVLAIASSMRKRANVEAAKRYDKLEEIVTSDPKKSDKNDVATLKAKVEKLDALIKEYPDTEVAIDAVYYKGKFQHDLGDYAEATKTFEAFASANPTRTPFYQYALLGAANAKMNLGGKENIEAALKQLEDMLAKVTEPIFLDQVRYQTGLCNAMLGNNEKAQAILKDLVEKMDPTGRQSRMKAQAERLMGLMRLANADDIAKLAKEFPASQVKPEPPKPAKEEKKPAEKEKTPAGK